MERRAKCFNWVTLIFFLIFLFWILLQLIAPFVLPRGSVADLSGLVGISDNEQVISQMSAPWNSIYSIGDRLCHQIAERSFFLNGNQMPFCARCTAIWLGLAMGLGLMIFYKIKLDEKLIYMIIIGIIPIAVDGLGQLFGLWESTNVIRFITGFIIGIICGVSLGLIFDELKNFYFKKKKQI